MRAALASLFALVSAPALAQSVVMSGAPVSTSVTVYRDMGRGDGAMNPSWLNGYALISEKRRVSLPVGESVVRFEGVADGMIAVSAVVSGLPGGVEEKNRDARLLSPASLLDGSLGNRVHIRRTNPATGKVSEGDAIIRSGSGGAVVLQTQEGVEALRCSGLPESLVYDAVPEGLSAKPTFSVHTTTPQATTAEVTLTYLATGFDWSAAYVAKVAEDGKTLDLSAWLTVANGNGADYQGTQLLAVAGKPNQTSDFRALGAKPEALSLALQCWPMDGTSTYPGWGLQTPPPPPPPSPVMYEMAVSAPAPMLARMDKAGSIVAQQEDLGDLKLYRVPVPVDVVPNGQKQVRLLNRASVPFTRLYTATVSPWESRPSQPIGIKLRMQNKAKDGLGLPLPSGGVVVMQRRGEAELLLADSSLADKAVGEKVEIDAGQSDQVRLAQELTVNTANERRISLILTNGTDQPAPVEISLDIGGWLVSSSSSKLAAKGTNKLWSVTVPANRTAQLVYALRNPH
tara:strand:+ start:881 stop:2422 length:1542 start_codon:yes stop_codon:yes gene_type:complete